MIHIKQDVLKKSVCYKYNITDGELHSDSRRADIISARRMFYYVARKHLKVTYDKIGSIFNQDHATVMYHERKLADFLEYDKSEMSVYQSIKQDLFGNVKYDTLQEELQDLQRREILIQDRIYEVKEKLEKQYNFLFN